MDSVYKNIETVRKELMWELLRELEPANHEDLDESQHYEVELIE